MCVCREYQMQSQQSQGQFNTDNSPILFQKKKKTHSLHSICWPIIFFDNFYNFIFGFWSFT